MAVPHVYPRRTGHKFVRIESVVPDQNGQAARIVGTFEIDLGVAHEPDVLAGQDPRRLQRENDRVRCRLVSRGIRGTDNLAEEPLPA